MRLGAFEYDATFEADGEVVVLFGHSGAGKSLTLQAAAGLLTPDAGHIEIAGRTVFDSASRVNVPPQARNAGYVVQELALFPHMTVLENVAFGVRGAKQERHAAARSLLDRLGLEGYERRMPASLSGGQRQRVALARALAREVPLLLLDEPFSALDESLRRTLRAELLRLRAEFGLTVVFVTHDLREAHLLADRLAVFDQGRILQFDRREDVFRHPTSRRVAELTGVSNVMAARVLARVDGALQVDVDGLQLRVEDPAWRPAPGELVELALRAERVNLRRGAPEEHGATNIVEAEVVEEHAYGAGHTLRFRPLGAGPEVEVDLPSRPYEVLGVGERRRWILELPPEDLHVMRPTA
jgi:molybdate transport system ATP-binding protein